MRQSPSSKRTYNSARRQEQARQTRSLILESARALFTIRGYEGTTVEAIAQEAGVAAETVYSIFKNKQAVLKTLVDITIVGDEAPVPLLQRPAIQAALHAQDQPELIRRFSESMYEIMNRMSPIFSLLRSAARTDAQIESLLDQLLEGRLNGMALFTEQLARIGTVREGSTPQENVDTVWAISSAEVFDLLIRDRRWSKDQYISWLTATLTRLLLP